MEPTEIDVEQAIEQVLTGLSLVEKFVRASLSDDSPAQADWVASVAGARSHLAGLPCREARNLARLVDNSTLIS